MKKNDQKTNVMRILEQKQVPYESHCYGDTGAVAGMTLEKAVKKAEAGFDSPY